MYLTINGCKHYVEDQGPKDATAILTLHGGGGMGDSRAKRRAYAAITDTYRLITFDARGCGLSEEVGTPSYAQWAADAEALRKELGLGKVVAAGGSSGGFLALEYALRYPESVAAVILRDTCAHSVNNDELERRARASGLPIDWDCFDRYWTGRTLNKEDFAQGFWQIMPLYPGRSGWDPVQGRQSWEGIMWHHKTHNYTVSTNFPGWDVRPRLKEIKAPVLIVHGKLDWVVPVERGYETAELLPNARLEVFDECGHGPHNEDNPRFIATVRDFLKSNGL